MVVRDYRPEDHEAVKALAEKHKLNMPGEGKLIVVETNSGKIEGFANIRAVFMIEPLVCENPLMADKLWTYISEKSRKGNVKILRCFIEQKHSKLLTKIGFYRIFKKHHIYEINFYNNKGQIK